MDNTDIYNRFGEMVARAERVSHQLTGIEDQVLLKELVISCAPVLPKLGLGYFNPEWLSTTTKKRGVFSFFSKKEETEVPQSAGVLAHRKIDVGRDELVVITSTGGIFVVTASIFGQYRRKRQFAPKTTLKDYFCYSSTKNPVEGIVSWEPCYSSDPEYFEMAELFNALSDCIEYSEQTTVKRKAKNI